MSLPSSKFSTIDPNSKAGALKRLRTLSRILDSAILIPGTGIGLGLDPIIGLLPVGGDFLGILLSSYIVVEAARLGAPAGMLAKMVLNIILDALIGAVPVLGDLFDFTWRANDYNLKLVEEHLQFPGHKRSHNVWFIVILIAGLLLLAIGLVSLAVMITSFLVGLFTGK
ncbi:MAG: DUF4112 domain-containing protein [Mastigocoleus sp. MO_167.B18]|uniref:DUF4112 domain-containing protein n=1 Tax=Mastigocoleus sp. MO_188.B34 TaxID=3036635 RepID=UPI00262DC2FF|nr:DUF4112 domain-containing protein [Mastigocoleus sp. MO_188.B34]MDJ0692853.1 DUF4112 domain-containing protein [Mastigocoleus sp. MO_188.B34]MDJ0771942.1 DUF4112 domain-containing protein [Mastigocoleus sp. MO_167.B18]